MKKERYLMQELILLIWKYTHSNISFPKTKNVCFSSIFVPVEILDTSLKLLCLHCQIKGCFCWTSKVILIFLHQKGYFKRYKKCYIKPQIKVLIHVWHFLNSYLIFPFLNLGQLSDKLWGFLKTTKKPLPCKSS